MKRIILIAAVLLFGFTAARAADQPADGYQPKRTTYYTWEYRAEGKVEQAGKDGIEYEATYAKGKLKQLEVELEKRIPRKNTRSPITKTVRS